MSQPDPLVVETTARIVQAHAPPEVIEAAEAGEWPDALWRSLEEAGLPLAWVAPERGGSGAGLAEGFAVVRAAAAGAAPVPLAETLLAGWLLAEAGLDVPHGPLAAGPTRAADEARLDDGARLHGTLARVPFAARAGHLAVVARRPTGLAVVLVETGACEIRAGRSLAGEPLDVVVLDGVEPAAVGALPEGAPPDLALRLGAALRAQQMAGALERVLGISLGYARDRVQFGRPIAKFQAVQHNLAVLAGESAAAGAAADGAALAIEAHGLASDAAAMAVAAAKVRAGEAAGTGAAIGHQVHGAIGFTREYELQRFTRRLWAWRDDFEPETVWAIRLGEQVARAGADALWPALTAL